MRKMPTFALPSQLWSIYTNSDKPLMDWAQQNEVEAGMYPNSFLITGKGMLSNIPQVDQ